MAQPALKIDELAESINSLALKRRKPSPSEIARLKNELGKSITVRNAEYYDFLGRIACLENDRARMITHYKEAITLSFRNNEIIQWNYFRSLENSGLFFKAREQLKVIAEKFSSHPRIREFEIQNSIDLCRFRETHQIINNAEFPLDKNYFLNSAISVFNKAELSDDEAENLCKLAYSLLEIKNLYFSTANWEVVDDCVFYTIYVDAPIEEMFDINWELAGVFVDNGKNRCNEVLAFKYSSIDVLEASKE